MHQLKAKAIILFSIFNASCSNDLSSVAKSALGSKSPEPKMKQEYIQGKKYEERKLEQETLRRALAQLKYFDGDGQLKFSIGGWNGSVFWFSKSLLMTNKHVIVGHSAQELEYITFSKIVFYKKNAKDQVRGYVKIRTESAINNINQAKGILQNRIANLKKLSTLSKNYRAILDSYEADLELLNEHKPILVDEKVFIPLEDAIERFWYQKANEPDIALIILKKPIDALLKEQGSKLSLEPDIFAENTLYDPLKHGWIYEGTPAYIAGYGRGSEGSPTDKRKSLTPFRMAMKNKKSFDNIENGLALPWLEREHYYFDRAESGDSGARTWIYLDGNGKISQRPMSLNSKKISVGINESSGPGGTLFTRDTMAPFWDELKKHSDALRSLPENPFPNLGQESSSMVDYLLSFKDPRPEDFIDALLAYAWYQEIIAGLLYEYELRYLWRIIEYKLTRNADKRSALEKIIVEELDNIFQPYTPSQNIKGSPSEINIKEWNELMLSEPLSKEQKDLVKRMIENKLFENFGDNYYCKIKEHK